MNDIPGPKQVSVFDERRIRSFQQKLAKWYVQYGRDLPWRHTRDPYHILVSEMMLQQTQVSRVLPKYREWLKVYPTFEALASAPLEDVQQLWRPLGYNYRSTRLHRIAKFVVAKCNSHLPDSIEELMVLPGIGRSTAGAILSFAFHKDAPIADTNIQRVILRIFGISGNPLRATVKKRVWQLAIALIPSGQAYIFNQALIDFGALQCIAKNPHCSVCFNKNACQWYRKQLVS